MAFTKEEDEYMLEVYEICEGDIDQAQKMFTDKFNKEVSCSTIYVRWRQARLKLGVGRGGNKYDSDTRDKEFRKFYEECGGNMFLMMQRSEKTQRALETMCRRLDLEYFFKIVDDEKTE